MTASRIILIPKVGGGGSGATSLDELSDVTITAAASGDILRHNGTAWVDTPGTTHFEAAGAVAAHEADTTNVHGIADTSALETTTGSASKVSTHAALTSSVHGISAFGATLVDDASASAARTTLGLVIGTDVAAQSHVAATSGAHGISAFGATLIDDADAATARSTLGLVIGTNVQAFDQDLADIAGVTRTKGDLIVASSSAWTDLAVGTDGHVLTADSAQATGVKWAAAAGGSGAPAERVIYAASGSWHAPIDLSTNPTTQTSSAAVSMCVWWPCYTDRTLTVAELANYCWTLEAGSTLRFGVYSANTSGTVNALLADYGTVSGASAGAKSVTGSQTVSGLFFVAVWESNNTTVRWSRGLIAGNRALYGDSGVANGRYQYAWRAESVNYSAGLPSTPPALTLSNSTDHANLPFVNIRYS